MTIENMTLLSLVLGSIGTITGCIGAVLSIEARRQRLTISRSRTRKHGYTITNHTLRPIPIESVIIHVRKSGGTFTPAGKIELEGLSLPGSLPPESSFDAYSLNIEQAIDVLWSDEYRLELRTQTGKIFRSTTEKQKK